MLRNIREFRKHLIIAGFRNVEIVDLHEFLDKIKKKTPSNVTVQFFDADIVAGWEHLYFAVFNALLSVKQERAISKSLGMEMLLYASAQHQIKRATEIIGTKPKSRRIAMILVSDRAALAEQALSAISEQVNAQRDESVLELQTDKVARIRKTFGITDDELNAIETRRNAHEALTDLVIERMALLSTKH